MAQPHTGPPPERQAEGDPALDEPPRLPGPGRGHRREPFREEAAHAARFAQNHVRTRNCKRTRYAAHGRSASVRVSRLWMRSVSTAQTGQGTTVGVAVPWTVSRDAAVSSCQEVRRSKVVSGNKREKKGVSSMQVRFEKEASLSRNIHPYGYAEPHHQKRARTTFPWTGWQKSVEYAPGARERYTLAWLSPLRCIQWRMRRPSVRACRSWAPWTGMCRSVSVRVLRAACPLA
jgi:hypothetical protein